MKKIFLILIIATSCSSDPETNQGCITGIHKGETQRSFIMCGTKEQYLSADKSLIYYKNVKWEKCDNCK